MVYKCKSQITHREIVDTIREEILKVLKEIIIYQQDSGEEESKSNRIIESGEGAQWKTKI